PPRTRDGLDGGAWWGLAVRRHRVSRGETMKRSIIVAGLAALCTLASPAYAAAAAAGAAAPPAAETMGVPGQVTIVLPKDIPWVEGTGSDQALLWGDPTKPGPYGYLIRWKPGFNSQPHSHDQDRFAWVISG